MSDEKEEIAKRRKDSWYDVFFAIEALGVAEDTVESALRKHVEKMAHVRDVYVYHKEFGEMAKVKNPLRNVEEAYSQVVNVKFLTKDLSTLLKVVFTYGPSAVEILGPDKRSISVSEVQDISNLLAGLVHQFAAAGAGGIVITPEEKK